VPSILTKNIAPFYVMEVLERAKELEALGHDIVHFEVGEPDLPTPEPICEEAISAIRAGETKYTHSLGIPELKAAISAEYRKNLEVEISEDRVIVTMGSSPAIFLAIISIFEPGDEILITDPHYSCYPQIIKIAGAVPKRFRIYEDEGFQIDIDRLKKSISSKTKGIIINSPSNPTGVVLEPSVIRDIVATGLTVISDEIYAGIVYEGDSPSVFEFSDDAFLISGFSKLYSMTGWRLGYLITPREYIRPIQKLQQNLFISANAFVQRAGVAAIEKAKLHTERMVETFGERRKLMMKGLLDLGFKIKSSPRGAFYLFVNAEKLGKRSLDLAFDILERCHVAVTPGIDFGPGGEGYLRFSFATSAENINEGMSRLRKYINL